MIFDPVALALALVFVSIAVLMGLAGALALERRRRDALTPEERQAEDDLKRDLSIW